MRSVFGFLALAALTSAAPTVTPSEKIPNNYIVVFKPQVSTARVNAAKSDLAYQHAISRRSNRLKGPGRSFGIGSFKGFSGEFDSKTIKQIAANPDVAYVEQEQVYRTTSIVEQPDAAWGLSRIASKTLGAVPSGAATFGTYRYDDVAAGDGVTVYVIDTGVYAGHSEFEGRASFAQNFAGDGRDEDCNGHGTHCAGTIAGKTYGVSRKAKIVGVKVLSCFGSGTTSGVIAGIDWVGNNHDPARGCVASMSLGGGSSPSLNAAVTAAVGKGCTFAVAAGNDGRDAKNTSPANGPSVITVGAIDSTDSKTSWSNFGANLAVFAPGNWTLSAWIGSADATNKISGTSMATPHVSGLIAYIMSKPENKGTPLAWDAVKKILQNTALAGVVKNPGAGSPNFLIQNGVTAPAAPGDGGGSGDGTGDDNGDEEGTD